MQTPKSRTSSSDVPQKTSPATPRTARKLKVPGSASDTIPSPNSAGRIPKDRSPKVTERRSPRSPISEKKRPSKVTELEAQLTLLQEELKKAKDQLSSTESLKNVAMQDAEEAKKKLAETSVKLEEAQLQLMTFSDSEDARLQELRKISQDRDREWESELEAIQKQHSMDSAALLSAMNEIQRLKSQLEMVEESGDAQAQHAEAAHAEIQKLRLELMETLELVENLKSQLNDCKVSEAQALEVVSRTQMQLEMAKTADETLRSESLKTMETCNSLAAELEKSKALANFLEEHVNKLQAELSNNSSKIASDGGRNGKRDDQNQLKAELNKVKAEADQLRSALDVAERRYHEEYVQSTLQIRSAYELMERAKSELSTREAELESKLKNSEGVIEDLKAKLVANETELHIESEELSTREAELESKLKNSEGEIEDLKAKLMAKETKLHIESEENEESKSSNQKIEEHLSAERESELVKELKRFEADLAHLKAILLDKDAKIQSIVEENELLKLEINKRDSEKDEVNNEAFAFAQSARAAEQEALMKLGYLTEEADKSGRKAARVTEQLDAAQAANAEMEAELRRLKVQSDQWRKAAEAAATMLSTGHNGKYVERTGSLDNNYHTIGAKLSSPFSEEMDVESPKKKNGNVLKKIGTLLKKGSK